MKIKIRDIIFFCIFLLLGTACSSVEKNGGVVAWQRDYEQRKTRELERLLGPVLGPDNFRVQLSADLDSIGIVKRVTVAIVVDSVRKGAIVSSRSPEHLELLLNLVHTAIGFDPERGDGIEIINMPFVTKSPGKGSMPVQGISAE